MKLAVCAAVLGLLVVAGLVSAQGSISMYKKPMRPPTAMEEKMLAAGYPIPLKGNIPQYGEYVKRIINDNSETFPK